MAEITWIKLRTNMFDDEKIKLIERMPEGDSILITWVKLLAYAGKVNCNGYIMINENIPMNVEQVAIIFNRPFEKVRYAISVLEKFGMLDVSEDEIIAITNWEKHQNLDGMEKIRLQNKERKRLERERKKTLSLNTSVDETCHVTVTGRHATDIEIDKEKDIKDIKTIRPKFSTFDLQASERLYELMLINNPSAKKPNFETWAKEVRLMRDMDGRTEEQIMYVIEWSQKDTFWYKNILSTSKLRKQFDKLVMVIKDEDTRNKRQQQSNKPSTLGALQNIVNGGQYDDRTINSGSNSENRFLLP